MRSTYDILQDLSNAWEGLTSVEKQELAETVAGKTQRSLFTAIMTNFESAVGATEAALESEGSAAVENEKRMDSLQGKVQQLEGAWQSFSRNTIDSDFIKNILSATTAMINFVDKIGGLPVLLSTVTAALLAFKGGLILDKTIKLFTTGLGSISSGLNNLIMALPNALAAFKSFSAGVISASTAMQAAMPLFSLIALAITGVVSAINYFNQAQKEATSAAIESSKEADEEIQTKKEKIDTIEKEIQKLTEERDALLKVADAGGEDAQASRNLAQDKQEEIEKRQMNIDKIKEENAELLKQREAAARSMTVNKSDSGLGWLTDTKPILDAGLWSDYKKEVNNINEQLKNADENTGAYKNTIEKLRAKYEELAQTKEKNNESSIIETTLIKELNNELEQNSKKYEEDTKVAEEFYDILLNGGEITQENRDWLQDFYDLTDEQMQQLSEGKDVYSEVSESATDAYSKIQEAMDKASDAQQRYNDVIDSNIEKVANYSDHLSILTEAQDMLTDSGHLTAEMYQQLSDNNLLQYLDVVNGKLVVNKDAFDMSSQAALDNATQAAKDSLAQQLLQIALADQNGTLDETAQKLGLVSAESNGVDTTNAVNQILKIGAAASSSKAELGALFKTMEGGKEVSADYNPSSQAQGLMNEAISRTNAQIAAIQSISLGSFKSSGSKGSSRKSSGGSGKRSSGGSSGSSSSTKEEYKAEVDALYWYKNALDNAEESVDKLNDALKNTDNFNEQEKYLNQLIEATNNQINKTNDLKNAQVGQINDFINQLRAQGFAIDYNSQNNELYINNMQHLADFTGDAAKNVEDLLDKIQDLNDDNRDLDGSIRDLTADVKDYYDQLADIPEQKLEKFNELMEDFQQSRLDQVQNQIDDLEHEMENDPRLKALEEQIEALEKQNDELDKQEEMEEKLLAVEEAKIKLQNAQQQKTLQVYREGQGWVKEECPAA